MQNTLRFLLLSAGIAAVAGCSPESNAFRRLYTEAGSEIETGDFGNSTMHNTLVQTNQQAMIIDMTRKFAADVPNAGDRVADLLSRIGFAPVYAGSLADVADTMAPGGLLFGRTTSDSVLRTLISGST